MDHQIDPVAEHRRQLDRARYARKKAEFDARRIATLSDWYVPRIDACTHALEVMSRAEKKLASMGILLLLMVWPVCAQTLYVIADTNQLKLIPSTVKVLAMTNLTVNQTFTEVVTNWTMVGPPIEVKDTNGAVIARRIFQVSNLLTNRYRVYDQTNYVVLSQTVGPMLETRHYDIPPPLPTLPVVMQLRQQR